MTRPGTSYGVCSHDGGMAGGGELSGSWGTALRHGGEQNEGGETEWSPRRRPELGRGRGWRSGAREEGLVGATGSWEQTECYDAPRHELRRL